jgi:hypothetical protein
MHKIEAAYHQRYDPTNTNPNPPTNAKMHFQFQEKQERGIKKCQHLSHRSNAASSRNKNDMCMSNEEEAVSS